MLRRFVWCAMIYREYLAQYIKSKMEYRGNLLVEMGSYLLWIATDYALIYFVILPGRQLQGWTLPQMILLLGLGFASLGLYFFVGVNLFWLPSRYILEGHLDRLILRPLDPYFQLLMEMVNLEDLITLASGLGLIAWSLAHLGVPFSALLVLKLACAIVGGTMVLLGINTAVATISFWLKDRQGVLHLMITVGDQISHYPLSIYPRTWQILFTWVIPLGFVSFFPAHLLLPEASPNLFRLAWLTPFVGLGCWMLGYQIWKVGLRSYESTGS